MLNVCPRQAFQSSVLFAGSPNLNSKYKISLKGFLGINDLAYLSRASQREGKSRE
jgi:hypothetical protein